MKLFACKFTQFRLKRGVSLVESFDVRKIKDIKKIDKI